MISVDLPAILFFALCFFSLGFFSARLLRGKKAPVAATPQEQPEPAAEVAPPSIIGDQSPVDRNQLSVTSDQSTVIGDPLSVTSNQLSVISDQLSVVGDQPSAVGARPSVVAGRRPAGLFDIISLALDADVPKFEYPKSLAAQVDEILQVKLEDHPLKNKAIRLLELPGQGMVVMVGLEKYPEIDAVPDEEIRFLIRESVAEWSSKQ